MVKRNKRKKGAFGIDDAFIIGTGLFNTIKSIIDTGNQLDAAQTQMRQQREAAIKNSNAERASVLQSNLYNLANNQQEEQNRIISTQNSAFKLGGRRCKKCGGRLTKFI
jgi:membrane protein involved in colicin uptake